MEPDDPIELTAEERRDIEADLDDLSAMRTVFSQQSVKGVVVACQDCGANHYYEWELLRDNLEHMLSVGEPRMHEPPFEIIEEEYIQWDYGKGYVDALTETGLEPDRRIEVTQCPWCKTPFGEDFAFCPVCGRTLATVRLYRELLDRGFEERDVRALLVRAGYEPF
ncbi:MAG TPA: DUF5319 family protein [Actinomycetota bacterium]